MPEGVVKWFNEKKGFGFIQQQNGNCDIFVHYSGIVGHGHRSLLEGEKVLFDINNDSRGPCATNVTRMQ